MRTRVWGLGLWAVLGVLGCEAADGSPQGGGTDTDTTTATTTAPSSSGDATSSATSETSTNTSSASSSTTSSTTDDSDTTPVTTMPDDDTGEPDGTSSGGEEGLCLACDCHDLYGTEIDMSCNNDLNPTGQGQHQWGSSYADWVSQTTGVQFSQRLRILQPAYESFHTHTFALTDASGGYIGLQTRQIAEDGTIATQARFSIWDTLEAEGPNCIPFGGEGIGYTCFQEGYPITFGSFYTLTVERGETVEDGTWWEGSVTHDETCETTVLGRIKVAHEADRRMIRSAGNFSEYFGARAADCMSVPQSIVEWTAPIVVDENGVATQDPLLNFSKAEPDDPCQDAGVEASGEMDVVDGVEVYRMTNGSVVMCE